MSSPDVVFFTRCHARHESLQAVLWQNCELVPDTTGVDTRVVILADRPTPRVQKVLDAWRDHPRVAAVGESECAVVSPQGGCRYIEAVNQLAEMSDDAGLTPRWIAVNDDDWLMGPGWAQHLKGVLDSEEYLTWRAVALFKWDTRHINVRQHHYSPFFTRYEPGWRWRIDMVLHIPDPIFERVEGHPELEGVLPWYLIDVGTTTEEERQAHFRELARAGKVDDWTRRFIEPPRLMPLHDILQEFPRPEDFYRWQLTQLRG